MMVDADLCDGCRECEEMCARPAREEGTVRRTLVTVVGDPESGLNVPLMCQQCAKPMCVEVCPTRACHRDPDLHVVRIDPERCIGCRSCVVACPFGAARFDEARGVSGKCDFCGGEPRCVAVCRPAALRFEPFEEAAMRKRRHFVARIRRACGTQTERGSA